MASKGFTSSSTSGSSSAASARARLPRTSIHTPLKPASVQDLKAKFDPGKSGSGDGEAECTIASSVTSATVKTYSPLSERKGTSSPGTGTSPSATSLGTSNIKSSGVTLSSISSSLQAAAQRKMDSAISSSSKASISTLSSNIRSAPKSSIALTTARPFSPSLSSKSGSASASAKSSPIVESSSKTTVSKMQSANKMARRWEPNSAAHFSQNSVRTRTGVSSNTNNAFSPTDLRSSFEKDKEGRLELPVMHITTSGSEVKVQVKSSRGAIFDDKLGGSADKTEERQRYLGKKVTDTKLDRSTPSGTKSVYKTEKSLTKEDSPPVQRSNRLVAREIKIERLDSGINVTSYKESTADQKVKSEAADKLPGVGTKIQEIKVERIPSGQTSKTETKPEFAQVKLRNTRSSHQEDGAKASPKSLSKTKSTEFDDKRLSRKISTERFERLMFDFQRGVPTENITRRGSETDHIELQQKARELSRRVDDNDTPIISKKKKEESIFTEGLKVSDFVKQVNKMNPEAEGPPKWKLQRAQSQASSAASSDVGGDNAASSDFGGDNFYQGIPGEDLENVSDDDDIYEKVTRRALSSTDGEQDGESAKTPGRRLGVYRKQKGNKKREGKNATTKARTSTLSDSEEKVIHSDGEGGWRHSDDSSSGTEYEDVGQDDEYALEEGDCLYEDLENITKPSSEVAKNKTLTHKLKNIFYKPGKNKKNKPAVDSGVSAGTDSDADILDDTDDIDNDLIETLSRTSSERSSGRLTRDDATFSSISTASAATTASISEEGPAVPAATSVNQSQTHMASSNMPPPPLPPRTSKALSQSVENSPPLPPRNPSLSNKATLGIPLDTVVPVSPTGHKASGRSYDNKKKDRFSFGGGSQDGSDTGSLSGKIEYIDYDPASPHTLERLERADSTSRKKKSLFSRKSGNNSRPVSATSNVSSASSYTYPDINAFPELRGDNSDDNLYVDLEDEHIYGKASDIYVSRFENEPLYQWYSKDKMIQNIHSSKSTDDLSDEEYLELEDKKTSDSVYEDIERLLEKESSSSLAQTAPGTKPEASKDNPPAPNSQISARDKPQRRSIIEDVFKNGGTLHRALWCQMPEVIESGLLQQLSDQEKKIQEAMFEIMTSEASYLKSLKVLISVFVMAPEFSADMSDRCVITRRDRQVLFSNIGHIKDISEAFLKDLEDRWQESCYLNDVCDVIHKHALKNFEPYVRYCSNQAFQDRALNALKLNPEFNEAVKKLEQHPECQFLPLASFLLLPMQRITRLPLLVDAICHRLEPGSPRHASAKKAMDSLTKVAKRCDEAAKKMQQTEQICLLASNLEFKIKEFPLVSASRFLVKQGELTLIKSDGTTRKPLSKLLGSNKEHVYLFLFNDILLVTKKKGTIFQVRDYCQRNSLHVEAVENPDKSRHIAPGVATGIPNILFLAMLANHENKQVELVLSCKSESERTRWIDAIMPTHTTSTDNERIYDYWDCPQFQCVRKYIAQQPDELTLEESDVINVTRKMADGWCEGERIRDGERGWFPASYTEEINNSHVRARNLRLRYRLMIASQDYSHVEPLRH